MQVLNARLIRRKGGSSSAPAARWMRHQQLAKLACSGLLTRMSLLELSRFDSNSTDAVGSARGDRRRASSTIGP